MQGSIQNLEQIDYSLVLKLIFVLDSNFARSRSSRRKIFPAALLNAPPALAMYTTKDGQTSSE